MPLSTVLEKSVIDRYFLTRDDVTLRSWSLVIYNKLNALIAFRLYSRLTIRMSVNAHIPINIDSFVKRSVTVRA